MVRDWCWLPLRPQHPTRWGRVRQGEAGWGGECGGVRQYALSPSHSPHSTTTPGAAVNWWTPRSCLLTRHSAPTCWHIAREEENGNKNNIFFYKLQHGWCVVRLGLLLLVSNSAKLISIWMKENIYFLWRRQYFHHLLFPHFNVEVQ